MQKILFILAILILGAVADPPTPYWGGNPIFTSRIRIISHNSTGEPYNMTASYYYNWNLKAQRYNYDENQAAQMCKATGHTPYEKVKCNVIYSTDGWIYVEFPSESFCCKCTNTFGGLRYDWLIANSSYIGRQQVNGVTADGWKKFGNPALGPLPNYYWATVGAQRPVKFLQNSTTKFKSVDFDMDSYTPGPIDPQMFAPPPNCQTRCKGICPQINSSYQFEEEKSQNLRTK